VVDEGRSRLAPMPHHHNVVVAPLAWRGRWYRVGRVKSSFARHRNDLSTVRD
jgi:hypothetical protein